MAIKILFEDVCDFNLGGIKELYLSTILNNKTEPYYPLNYYVSSGGSIIDIDENISFQRISIIEDAEVSQNKVDDAQGKWYEKNLTFGISKLKLSSLRFINSFLFKKNVINLSGDTRPVNINGYNTTAIFLDMNGSWWIAGYDVPFSITAFELVTGESEGENYYSFQLSSKSYNRIRKIDGQFDCETIVYTAVTTTTTTTAAPTTTTTTTVAPPESDLFGLGSTLGNACSALAGNPDTLYWASGAFGNGVQLFTDSALTVQATGFVYVAWNFDTTVYNINSSTGVVGTSTGHVC